MASCTATQTILRFGRITLGYLTACLVAGLVAGAAGLLVLGPLAVYVALAVWIGATVFALVPSALVIAYAEWKSVRSADAHYALGAAIGFATALFTVIGSWTQVFAGLAPLGLLILALCTLAGAAAGRVYHAIAGHDAGCSPLAPGRG